MIEGNFVTINLDEQQAKYIKEEKSHLRIYKKIILTQLLPLVVTRLSTAY